MNKKKTIIIGAGPAGLTAALELLRRTDIKSVLLEADDCVGGISRTVNYRGNRIDIGGHRFFSKSDWVMNWWKEILPVQSHTQGNVTIAYHGKTREVTVDNANSDEDRILLIRNRLSRIYFLRKFFDYPIRISAATIANLGLWRMVKIGASYLAARICPIQQEKSLQDFLINRFGQKLYLTFFKDYTEKVWGVSCQKISAEWGAQRIKGLSISQALRHALSRLFMKSHGVEQKNISTSLIERFLYPKLGPGQMWEEVARKVSALGGEIHFQQKVVALVVADGRVVTVTTEHRVTGERMVWPADYVFTTMPVRDLIGGMGEAVPPNVRLVADGLPYRSFLTVGLLVRRMLPNAQSRAVQANHMPPDNWIYIQEPDVKLGRLQIFNNWSSALVKDPDTIWLGLEYFCDEGDSLWSLTDEDLKAMGRHELAKVGMIEEADVLDSVVIRMPKAYPAYFGSYNEFGIIREFLDSIENLYPVGRNGMHRYNNQDHSMLTAKLAVDNIVAGVTDKSAIWAVNIDDEYHEESKKESTQPILKPLRPYIGISATTIR